MLKITTSRTGKTTALLNGVRLHSSYDPVREAERFIKERLKGEKPAVILLLGAGLGYIIQAIQHYFPYARVVPVFYSREVSSHSSRLVSSYWHPGLNQTLLSFLREEIPELDSEGLEIIEWPASARLFPDISRTAHLAASQLLKEHRGSLLTTVSVGKRWIQNSFINFVSINSTLCEPSLPFSLPILIAASGPSLERSAGLITRYRDRLFLISVPSAVFFLLENGLKPDLVIMTDPSFYAVYHLHPATGNKLKLAMPLSAATGTWRIPADIYLISQENFFERALLAQAGFKAPAIPPQGTVTATAMELALGLSSREVILTGLDLCYEDLRSHVRPNAFEFFLLGSVDRLHPFRSLMYARAVDSAPNILSRTTQPIRSGTALETYAGWFSGLNKERKARIFRLNPAAVKIPGMCEMHPQALDRFLRDFKSSELKSYFVKRPQYPGIRKRTRIALSLLSDWDHRVGRTMDCLCRDNNLKFFTAENLQVGLAYYVDPVSLTEIKKALRLEGEKKAVQKTLALLEKERQFLRLLSRKIEQIEANGRKINP
ncbi:hypothetical protein ES703_27376 [subsurface metagenome]